MVWNQANQPTIICHNDEGMMMMVLVLRKTPLGNGHRKHLTPPGGKHV